jgi:hypothetical protein
MEITYRRTVQVREYESITIEAKTTSDNFTDAAITLEDLIDDEIIEHRNRLRARYKQEEFADDEDLS